MYDYQIGNRYFAQIADSIKELGEQELSELGAYDISPAYRGIYFNADKKTLYKINYCSKLISRIIAPLISFNCHTTDHLYKKAKSINWPDFISLRKTFAIFSNVSNSRINNSHYASLRIKDAIADSFKETSGKRPDVERQNPDVWVNLHIDNDRAVISIETSGGSLHRRGYREETVEAPMQETVAAAIIRYSGWDGSVPIYDPMCGSGTLLCEALMYYCRIPTGFSRKRFGFESLPDFDSVLWKKVKKQVDSAIRKPPAGLISGSDISKRATDIARTNLKNLKYGDSVKLSIRDIEKSKDLHNMVIVTNPPYGIRIGDRDKLELFYKSLGDFLKQKCTGSNAYIYFGEREFIKKIGLKAKWKKPLETGGLDGRLVKYELY